jgi:hypothetical protein
VSGSLFRRVTALSATAAAVMLMAATPALAGSPDFISQTRAGAGGEMTFNWTGAHTWSGGGLNVHDTSCDSNGVHVNIGDQAAYEGSSHYDNKGCGTSVTFNSLSFNSPNYKIQYLRLQACVDHAITADACSTGSVRYNPYK